jgi:hypothetical protein
MSMRGKPGSTIERTMDIPYECLPQTMTFLLNINSDRDELFRFSQCSAIRARPIDQIKKAFRKANLAAIRARTKARIKKVANAQEKKKRTI